MEQLKRELRTETLWRALPAEFLGTAVLVFCGVASALAWAGQQPPVLQVALGFGLAVAAASLFTQGVGAGHLNPAVSLALLVSLRVSPLRALLSALMQSLGSIAACALLQALTPPHVRGELGLSKPSAGVTEIQALVVEVIITFQLVLCVFVISHKENHFEGSAQVALGVSVTLGHLVAGSLIFDMLNFQVRHCKWNWESSWRRQTNDQVKLTSWRYSEDPIHWMQHESRTIPGTGCYNIKLLSALDLLGWTSAGRRLGRDCVQFSADAKEIQVRRLPEYVEDRCRARTEGGSSALDTTRCLPQLQHVPA